MTQEELLTAQDFKDAITVQDACNLSGVVHSFSRVVTKVRATLRAEGNECTENVNTHVICVMYASKIASLTGCEASPRGMDFAHAYDRCENRAKECA